MPGRDILVVGASAGGVEALTELARGLPADLPAAVFMVLHVPAHATSVLPRILSRAGRLPTAHAREGEPIRPGHIYVAPPDHHMLLRRGYVYLARGPRENSHRPAVDPLFRTAARAYDGRVVGVLLSGALDDGTAGLAAIKRRGGTAVVQNPDEALFSSMPRSAIENVEVDHVVSLAEMPALLSRLAHEPVREVAGERVPDEMEQETQIEAFALSAIENRVHPGTPSTFGCPECGGTLWELQDGELTRFRCRVGHAYSTDSLLAEQSESLEAALWTAFRALEESASLARCMAARARSRAQPFAAARFAEQAQDAQQRAALVRRLLLKGEIDAPAPSGSTAEGREPYEPKARRE